MISYARHATNADAVQTRLDAYFAELETLYPFSQGVYFIPPERKTGLHRDIERVVYLLEEKRKGNLPITFPLPEEAVSNILLCFPDAASILTEHHSPRKSERTTEGDAPVNTTCLIGN
jgi:hypothetical protein